MARDKSKREGAGQPDEFEPSIDPEDERRAALAKLVANATAEQPKLEKKSKTKRPVKAEADAVPAADSVPADSVPAETPAEPAAEPDAKASPGTVDTAEHEATPLPKVAPVDESFDALIGSAAVAAPLTQAASSDLPATKQLKTEKPAKAPKAAKAPKPPKAPKAERTADEERRQQKVIAWTSVGVVLAAALIFVFAVVVPAVNRENGGANPKPTNTSTNTSTPSPTNTGTSSPSPTKTSGAPVVDPGATSPMDIQTWGVTVQVSGQFGRTEYLITGNKLAITSALTSSFPESCAALRTGWGIEKGTPPARTGSGAATVAGSTYTVTKPAGQSTCSAEPKLYDQVWGLMQAMVDSTKALQQ